MGVGLVIRQVNLGMKATIAISMGTRLIVAEYREMNKIRNSVIHTIHHRWLEGKEKGND